VRGIRETALCREREVSSKFRELGGDGLLAGNTLFEIRQRIPGDEVHAPLQLSCELVQMLQILRSPESEVLVAGCTHTHHNS
jgi:hypothetical protein